MIQSVRLFDPGKLAGWRHYAERAVWSDDGPKRRHAIELMWLAGESRQPTDIGRITRDRRCTSRQPLEQPLDPADGFQNQPATKLRMTNNVSAAFSGIRAFVARDDWVGRRTPAHFSIIFSQGIARLQRLVPERQPIPLNDACRVALRISARGRPQPLDVRNRWTAQAAPNLEFTATPRSQA